MKPGAFYGAAWFAVVLVFRLSPDAAGDTIVDADITTNATWSLAGSPYILNTNSTVATAATLTIDPGVEVQIKSGVTLTVAGALRAIGTDAAPIRFTRQTGDISGGRLRIVGSDYDAMASGVIEHGLFDYLSGSGVSALQSDYAEIAFSNCEFMHFAGRVIHLTQSRVTLEGCRFDDTGDAIKLVRCAGHIRSNTISRVSRFADGIAIDLTWEGPDDGLLVIEGNEMEGRSRESSGGGDGIDFSGASHVILRHNIIRDFGDKGISIGEGSTDLWIYNNLISDCLIGIAIKDESISSMPRAETTG